MSISGKQAIASSLQALRRKAGVEALARLRPLLLLQILISLSQSLSGQIANPQAIARVLLLDGQQRLNKLLDAAPRLEFPLDLERVLEARLSDGDDSTPEGNAVQALIELCLGLMLQWLHKDDHSPYIPPPLPEGRLIFSSYIFAIPSFLLLQPPRTRACPIIST